MRGSRSLVDVLVFLILIVVLIVVLFKLIAYL